MVADEKTPVSLSPGGEMVELSLLLPGWQADALERMADDAHLTIAQYLRRLVNDSIDRYEAARQPLFPDRH